MLHSDNDSEFKADVIILMKKYNIKIVRGSPYHPQSQGLIEKFNRYIKKYLVLSYLTTLRNSFNCEEILSKLIDGYNNRKNTITKYSPYEIFSSKNANLFEEVRKNTRDYYRNIELKQNLLCVHDKFSIAKDVIVKDKFIREKKQIKNKKGLCFHTLGYIKQMLPINKVEIIFEFSLNTEIDLHNVYFCDISLLYIISDDNEYQATLNLLKANHK